MNKTLSTPRPSPVADYADAVGRVESKITSEVDFDPGSHTILLMHGVGIAEALVFVHSF